MLDDCEHVAGSGINGPIEDDLPRDRKSRFVRELLAASPLAGFFARRSGTSSETSPMGRRARIPSFSSSIYPAGGKTRRLKPVTEEKPRRNLVVAVGRDLPRKKRVLTEAHDRVSDPPDAPDDKWISGLDCIHSKPTRSPATFRSRRFLERRQI